jgi:hypothetical protein
VPVSSLVLNEIFGDRVAIHQPFCVLLSGLGFKSAQQTSEYYRKCTFVINQGRYCPSKWSRILGGRVLRRATFSVPWIVSRFFLTERWSNPWFTVKSQCTPDTITCVEEKLQFLIIELTSKERQRAEIV